MNNLLASIALAAAPFQAAGAQDASANGAPNLADWGLHCWCLTARHTPQRIIRADNNGRVLQLAATGITRAELDRKLPGITESQLALLQTYGLLTREGDRYTTAFPAFGPETIGPIRTRLMALARRTLPQIRQDVEKIVASARAQKHPASGYAMVFGYALDGTLWDELPQRIPLPETTLDLDHPFWRGAFWAIYPERTGAPGRNEVIVGDRTLIGVWTDDTVKALNAKLEDVQSKGVRADLSGLPTIADNEGDPVRAAGQRIATKLVSALVDSEEGRSLLEQFPERLRQQAILAMAHEFIWSVMDQLVLDKAVSVPRALSSQKPSDADIQELMFVLEKGTEH